MTIQDIQEHYEPIKMICDRIFSVWDKKTARDMLHLFKHEILVDENIKSQLPVIEKYQELASHLRAVSFVNSASEDSPGIFLNDILFILDRSSDDVISDLDTFFVRFQDPDNFTKYQKLGMDNLLLNKQRLSAEPIVAGDERKVTPTISNWLKYFYYQVGGGVDQSRIKIAEFYGKDPNVVKLKPNELNRLKNLVNMQEFLRLPAREIMKMHQEALFDLGNGIMASFEDGEFYLLEDEETLRKRLFQEREIKKYDGEEPKDADVSLPQGVPDLKPVSSSMPTSQEEILGNTVDEDVPATIIPDDFSISQDSSSVHSNDVRKESFNEKVGNEQILVEDKNHTDSVISIALRFDEKLEEEISSARLEIERAGLSFENIISIARGVLDEPDLPKIIGLLEVISKEGMIEKIMTDPVIQKALGLFVNSTGFKVNSTRGGLIAVMVRMFVEGAGDGSTRDSAKVLARIIDLLPAEFHESLESMIYYDMSSKSFVWE